MKPIVLSSCLALAALSLFAADPQTSNDNAQPQRPRMHLPQLPPRPYVAPNTGVAIDHPVAQLPPPLHVQTILSAQTDGSGDSRLVRAAKAANRLGKKPTQVITNETLVHGGGHFTTSTTDEQALAFVHTPAGPSAEQMAAEARRAKAENAAAAEQARRNDEKKRLAAARAAALAEGDTPEGLYVDPPALEGPMEPVKPSTPETMKPNKPPL